jgi:hypothetical protein
MIISPVSQLQQLLYQAFAKLSKFIFNPQRDLGINFAVYDPVFFQGAKSNSKHPLGNTGDPLLKFIEPALFILAQPEYSVYGPFIAKPRQHILYRADILLAAVAFENFSNPLTYCKRLIISAIEFHLHKVNACHLDSGPFFCIFRLSKVTK